jgi:hypothetical protein
MNHLWIDLKLAQELGWSVIACVAGVNTGPAVTVLQCERCGTTRFETEESRRRFAKLGCLLTFEPEICQR